MKTQLHQLLWGILFVILLTASHSAVAFFDPTIGTFISRDPIGEDGGQNLYGFVGNDPVGDIDFLGECGKCECIERVQLTNIRQYQNGKQFGHKFDIVVTLKSTPSTDNYTHYAILDWSEKVTPQIPWQTDNPRFRSGDWNNMYQLFQDSPTFDPWNNHSVPNPTSTYSVTITDDPASVLGLPKRTLDFRITVKSSASPSCKCDNQSITRTAEQILASTPNKPTIRKFTY